MTEEAKLKEQYLADAVENAKTYNILLPTFRMLDDPSLIPQKVKDELKNVDMNDVNPLNLFRISWFNEPVDKGGLYQPLPNFIEIPKEIHGLKCRILMIVGKYFPTGSHKVGASYGPLVTRLTTGLFSPKVHKALWPSTGNYCRGGAFNSALMHSPCIAVLPEDMSKERFDWLEKIGAEVVKTPGGESNVKEVFDMNNKLVEEGKGKVQSFNQFSDFSNPIFHYWCTGRALEKVFEAQKKPGQRFAGIHLTQGSAGAISGASEYLRKKYPLIKVAAGEALQCPTLYQNGFGDHRIEGIGDKHVPWVFNVKNLDMVIALDDNDVMDVMHLFNHPEGIKYLKEKGVPEDFLAKLPLLGISGVANMLGCIKEAKLYEFNENDIVMSVCTDSMAMYQSRIKEHKGEYTRDEAVATYAKSLMGININHCLELTYMEKKRCHNLKYFTWKEQQGKTTEEVNAQWYDDNYWKQYLDESVVDKYDKWIMEFNQKTGLAEKYGIK